MAEKDEPHLRDHSGYAVRHGPGTIRVAEKFPERFFDVGIAEEHAIGDGGRYGGTGTGAGSGHLLDVFAACL